MLVGMMLLLLLQGCIEGNIRNGPCFHGLDRQGGPRGMGGVFRGSDGLWRGRIVRGVATRVQALTSFQAQFQARGTVEWLLLLLTP